MSDFDTMDDEFQPTVIQGEMTGTLNAYFKRQVTYPDCEYLLEFADAETVPQNVLFHQVEKVEFDDEGSFVVTLAGGKRFNIIFEWADSD